MADFLPGGPKIAEVNRLAVLAKPERILGKVEIDPAGQREGDNQRRGHEEVGFDGGVDPGFEITVPGQDAGGNQIVFDDGFFHGGGEGTRISDTGGASITHEIESELIQVGLKSGGIQIIGYDAGSGGEGCLDGGIDREAPFNGFFGQESCGEHDRGIRCVCAGGDGGNDHGSVSEGTGVIEIGFSGHGIRSWSVGNHLLFVGGHADLGRLGKLV